MAEVLTPTWASGQNYLQIIDCGCCGVDAYRRTEGGGKLRQLVWPFRNQTKKVALSAATCEFQKGKLQNGLASMQALTGQMTFRAEGARRQRDSRWSPSRGPSVAQGPQHVGVRASLLVELLRQSLGRQAR